MHKYVRSDVYGGETRENYWQDFGKGWIKIYWIKGADAGKDLRMEMRAEKIKKLRANFAVHVGIIVVRTMFFFVRERLYRSHRTCSRVH